MSRTAYSAALLLCVAACHKQQPPAAPPAPTVSVAQPLQRDVVNWDEYIGHFEAPQSVDLRARVTGVVTKILFRDGQDVRAGQPLFVIDPRPYEAQLRQAEAQVASSRATLINAQAVEARSAQLVQAQAVSREELENNQAQTRTARANLQSAEAQLYNARLNLGFTTVRAPVAGRVSSRRVSLGDQVTSGDTLLTTVVSLDPIWFTFDGAESFYLKYLRQAQEGQRKSSRVAPNPVDIQLSDESGYRWHGHMAFVDNAVDPAAGTIRAHAVVANPDHFLTPGLFGRARLLGSGTYRAMLVPDEVISADQSRKVVYVLGRDGKVVQRPVEVGPEVMGLRAVRDGLAPTDLVVLDGLGGLQPGMKVQSRRTTIKPRSADSGPQVPQVTVPEPSAATLSGQGA
ncbi:efflux RND transporter periplasmic adaptor subunit [Sphingomonas morindae]|uniref:Efflux RND transporter periplasmic adaptor subunit n=1 Tax=Sphingomonas morindae TaxID=1541170 RepID=A0ABY4X6B6_9SPHN|nr:efflux RND transporter periplasmic adaptor subunit [Sphingomonas morindae]USI72407.1 efflux RND transporter periplasmic adaptor subunit [Sphingomonas morindae]